jgi:7-cyano-7-deazaguanine reductase
MAKQSHPLSEQDNVLSSLTLGKSVDYATTYAPQLLQAVPRLLSRTEIGLAGELPFHGADFWTGYELSWLTPKGKPQVAILQLSVPFDSPNLIESKSFKLYLNSFNQEKIKDIEQLIKILNNDLSDCAGAKVNVELVLPAQFPESQINEFSGHCIDDIDIEITQFELEPSLLSIGAEEVKEVLYSNLLKSNCLITNQPDWASVQSDYKGKAINRESLLRYLVSFRLHNEFHEQCVERIFCDILHHCQPQELTVYARYTRRGGLDINPYRSNVKVINNLFRNARQ